MKKDKLFREIDPRRTCTNKYKNYRQYKKVLADDFNKRCGYCDDYDFWVGGRSVFHIDHFAPRSKFPDIENEYSNLVYSCPYCNRSKGNDWVTDNYMESCRNGMGYIDPCHKDYKKNFNRGEDGKIIPLTTEGEYMYKKLKLYLKRHRYIWQLTRLKSILDELKCTSKKDEYLTVSIEFQKYLDYLMDEVE